MSKSELSMPIDENAPMTLAQACAYAGLSRSALYHAVSSRRVACYKAAGGRLLRFRRADLDVFCFQDRRASSDELAREAAQHDSTRPARRARSAKPASARG